MGAAKTVSIPPSSWRSLGRLGALGLLGVPALLVAALGAAVATLAIAVFHRALEGHRGSASRSSSTSTRPARF